MTGFVALLGIAATTVLVGAFLVVGVVVGALVVVALLVVLAAACVAVGMVIGDAVGSIGRGGRRAPDVRYWSTR